MKLDKKESIARTKIIQENHLGKEYQKRLDKWIIRNCRTYRSLYADKGEMQVIITQIGLAIATDKMTAAFRAVGCTAKQAAHAFGKLAQINREVTGNVNNVTGGVNNE